MKCDLCPRFCEVDRRTEYGFCNSPQKAMVSRAALHLWEEPCISGKKGSGTVFFCGCNLGCVFCQNHNISRGENGVEVSPNKLKEIYAMLIQKGAHNINLVTPTHYIEPVLESLSEPLNVPVVWNSGGYERVEQIERLRGKVNIFLPDLKYSDNNLALKYSGAPDYFERAKNAILKMYDIAGDYEIKNGIMQKGLIIRHLILPEAIDNSLRVIDWVANTFEGKRIKFSLMSQYTPYIETPYKELSRRITGEEYEYITDYLEAFGYTDGYTQELSSAKEEYTPDFDLTGVL